MGRPVILSDNLFNQRIYPNHTLAASTTATGKDVTDLASGRRIRALTGWFASSLDAGATATATFDQPRAFDLLFIDRDHNLAGESIQLRISDDGFVTDDAGTMGCSPDSFVGADGLLEVKCLKPERHIHAILYYQKNGRCPTDYVQQTQGQLLITGRKWCDLLFYSPDLPLLTIRQEPDRTLQMALLKGIATVCKERDEVLAALHRHAGMAKAA